MNLLSIFEEKKRLRAELLETKERLERTEKRLQTANSRVESLETQNKAIPRDFDYLINLWHPEQANALVYKLINHYRNKSNPDKDLLNRWGMRIIDAVATVKKEE